MLTTLQSVGFKRIEAELYVYMVQKDRTSAPELAQALCIQKQQIYRIIKRLEQKRMLKVSQGRPNRFMATAFSEVLDILIRANKEEARNIESNKEHLLFEWRKLLQSNKTVNP
jgi:sugar-specific transcriptional regulator TrmB